MGINATLIAQIMNFIIFCFFIGFIGLGIYFFIIRPRNKMRRNQEIIEKLDYLIKLHEKQNGTKK